MGAVFRVPIEHAPEPPEGASLVGLVPAGAAPIWELDLTAATVFLVGAERLGLPAELIERCDSTATVPLAVGAESRNAAAAATVALYEAVRQRSASSTRA
jgi:tRNA G18 (ribose-2'-O)-methylase SpoU